MESDELSQDRALSQDRTWLSCVLFTDIVNYSSQSVQQQMGWKRRFNDILNEALADVDPAERYILDTGDGAAVCFMGAPEPAMQAALKLRESFVEDDKAHADGLRVRIGINLGPLRLMRDVNGRVNAVGEAINVGQRVMSFAGVNEILVSRSFYETISCLSDTNALMFRLAGTRRDKHEREHIVYELVPDGFTATKPVVPAASSASNFDPVTLEKISAILSHFVGPIAKRLVKDDAARSENLSELRDRMLTHVADEQSRKVFLQQWTAGFGDLGASKVSTDEAGDAKQKREAQQMDPAVTERVSKELAQYVGPMAKLIVAKAAKNCGTLQDLVAAVQQEIPSPKDRDAFRTAAMRFR